MKTMIALVVLLVSHQAQASYYSERNLASLHEDYWYSIATPTPWVGWWWPYNEGGIASGEHDAEEISPAEKLDLVFGSRNWVAGWEHRRHGHGRRSADWWGHCNGWAVASIMEVEPRDSVTIDGVQFAVRDRKAILTEYWMESGADFIGRRVWNSNDTRSSAFWDVTPAQFHLLLANVVGRAKRSLIFDRYTGAEVWNQPMVAYEFDPITKDDYLGPDPRYRNVYRVNVSATIWWANDEVFPDDVTPEFEWEEDDYFVARKLHYELWVDAPLKFDEQGKLSSSGNIILTRNGVGGRWKNGTSREALVESHPDFMWIPLSYARSSGQKNPRLNDAWVQKNIAE